MESHADGSTKCCHYFNNGKTCPYENIGCMFLHQHSERCYFGDRCKNKLCQFKHREIIENENDRDNEEESVNELANKFEKLSDEEKYESKDLLCTLYCKSYEYHRCSQEHYDILKGCDVMNITEDFVDDTEEDVAVFYPCDKCDARFDDHTNLKTHFETNHTHDKSIKCCVSECDFQAQLIDVLTMHIGVDHLELVRSRL